MKMYTWNRSTQEDVPVKILSRPLRPHVWGRRLKKISHARLKFDKVILEKAEKWEKELKSDAPQHLPHWGECERKCTRSLQRFSRHVFPCAVCVADVKLGKKNVDRVENHLHSHSPLDSNRQVLCTKHARLPYLFFSIAALPTDRGSHKLKCYDRCTKQCSSALACEIKEAAHGEQRPLYHRNGTCEQHSTVPSQGRVIYQ